MAPYRGSARPAYERGTHSPSPFRDQPIQGQPASAVRVPQGSRRRGGTTGPSRQRGGASQEEIQVTPLGQSFPLYQRNKVKGYVRGEGVGFHNGSGSMRLSSSGTRRFKVGGGSVTVEGFG
ncbi:hypothetical protein DPEC_G00095240 [Dallia pectoralis]|uniref:Uncharacterized protein n=1 Tax=Dallia pectoralis TaxID=75939 RepID=A0ACC2GW70_DALPE|nr:hypothetical protein DPEC_G00095240 [Dallia pectoralis]